jgi:hypothetical protein
MRRCGRAMFHIGTKRTSPSCRTMSALRNRTFTGASPGQKAGARVELGTKHKSTALIRYSASIYCIDLFSDSGDGAAFSFKFNHCGVVSGRSLRANTRADLFATKRTSRQRTLSTWNPHETLFVPLDTSMKESTIRARPDGESRPGRLADFKWPSRRI